jgi:hypothetical protein
VLYLFYWLIENGVLNCRERQRAKAKLKALRRLKTTGDAEKTNPDTVVSQDQLIMFSRQMGANFKWKPDRNRFDILYNKDEVVATSDLWHALYEDYLNKNPEAVDYRYDEMDYGIKWLTIGYQAKGLIDDMRKRFYETQIWNLFESACIYHRY